MKTPEISTLRLRLTPLVEEDAEALFAYRSDPEVAKFQGWAPTSAQEAMAFIRRGQGVAFGAPDTWFQLALREKDGEGLVGDLGLHFLGAGSRQVELGITISPQHQRRGLAREAIEGALGHLFGAMGVHRVIASVDPRNEASCALLARVGMRREAHFVKSLWFKGSWVDDVVFALLGEEWAGRRGDGP